MNAGSAEFILILGIPIAVTVFAVYEYRKNCTGKGALECILGGVTKEVADAAPAVVNAAAGGVAGIEDTVSSSILPPAAQRFLGVGKYDDAANPIAKLFRYTPVGQIVYQAPKLKQPLEKAAVKLEQIREKEVEKIKQEVSTVRTKVKSAAVRVEEEIKHDGDRVKRWFKKIF